MWKNRNISFAEDSYIDNAMKPNYTDHRNESLSANHNLNIYIYILYRKIYYYKCLYVHILGFMISVIKLMKS